MDCTLGAPDSPDETFAGVQQCETCARKPTTKMPKEDSLPTRKKMRKGTHSCFECTFVRSLRLLSFASHTLLSYHPYILSITIALYCYLLANYISALEFVSNRPQVAAARFDASSSLTTQKYARSASPGAAAASTRRVQIQMSLSTTGRTFVKGYHDLKPLSIHC